MPDLAKRVASRPQRALEVSDIRHVGNMGREGHGLGQEGLSQPCAARHGLGQLHPQLSISTYRARIGKVDCQRRVCRPAGRSATASTMNPPNSP